MEISPISILLLGLVIGGICWFKNMKKIGFFLFCLLVIFEFFINIGFFFRSDVRTITNMEFLTFLCFLSSIYLLKKETIHFRTLVIAVSWLFSILMGIFVLIVFPLEYPVIPFGILMDLIYQGAESREYVTFGASHSMRLFRVFLHIPILFYLGSSCCPKEKLFSTIIFFSRCYMGLLSIQFLLSITGLSSLYFDLLDFWFIDVRDFGEITRFGLPILSGLTREPSHLAIALLLPGMICVTQKSNSILLSLILIFLVLSMSLRGFIVAAVLIVLYLSNISGVNLSKILVRLAGIFILLAASSYYFYDAIFIYFFDRIESLVTGEYIIGSEGVRTFTVFESFEYFLDRPILGIGLGTANSYGFWSSILSNTGFVGTFLWIYLNFIVLRLRPKKAALSALAFLGVFSGNIGWMYSIVSSLLLLSVSNNAKEEIS